MWIQSKRGSYQEVTEEKWEEMKSLGFGISWKPVKETFEIKEKTKPIEVEKIEVKKLKRETKKIEDVEREDVDSGLSE